MSFHSDDFDSISLPDISDIDLSVYDHPPPPPAPPPKRAPVQAAPVDDDDAQYWQDLPIRVDSQGNYVVQNSDDDHHHQQDHAWEEDEQPVGRAPDRETNAMEVDRPESSQMGAQRAQAASIAQQELDRPQSLSRTLPKQDAQADAEAKRALEEAMRMKADLERQLKQYKEETLAAKGEASNLRRLMADKEEKAQGELAAATERHHAAMEKMKKKEQERQQQDEARAVKHALDTYGVTGSVRRPTGFGPTQSVNRAHARGHNQSQTSSQQTPAPLSRTTKPSGVALGMTAMGGGFSQKFAGGGSASPMVIGSVNGKGKGKGKEVDRGMSPVPKPHLPPVPKFPNLQNSFAATSKRSTKPAPAQQPAKPTTKPPTTPTNPDRISKSFSRSPSKASPLSKSANVTRSPYGRLGSHSPHGDREGQGASDGSPSPSKKKRRVEELGGAEYADDGGLGMDVDSGLGPEASLRADEAGDRKIHLEHDEQAEDGVLSHGEDDEDDEEDFWVKDEKATMLSVIFNHLAEPLATKPSRSSPSQSIQIVLAPLPAAAGPSVKDMEDHSRSCGRIMAGLSGTGPGGGDPVYDVVRGLNGVARVFEKLNLLTPLTATLKLLSTLLIHLPRAARSLVRLQSFPALVASIKDRVFPEALPAASTRKGLAVVDVDATEVEGREEKAKVVQALVDVLEVIVWEAGDGEVDVLTQLVELPYLVSGLLLTSQPPRVVLQAVRILVYLSLHESLFRPLFSFPDVEEDPVGRRPVRDPCRIPLVETLCKYLRDPHPMATPIETVVLSLDILSFFRTIIHKHQDEVALLLAQSRSFIPTLIVSLEHRSSQIWGVGVSAQSLRMAIPPLLSSLQLLQVLLNSPANSSSLLPDKLRQAPRSDFNACWERFMVGFGRICYADIPDLKEIFWAAYESDEGGKGKGATDGEREADVWEKELIKAGEIALDIFDSVIEGPEGDLIYAIFTAAEEEPGTNGQTIDLVDSDTEDEQDEDQQPRQAEQSTRKGRTSGGPASSQPNGRGAPPQKQQQEQQQEIIVLSDDD